MPKREFAPGMVSRPGRCSRIRARLHDATPLGELAVIAASLVLGGFLVMEIPLVFGPNGYVDPLGYREYDEPETAFQMALGGLAIFGPLLIGGLLMVWALRRRR